MRAYRHARLVQALEAADDALAKLRTAVDAERSKLAGARAQLELLVQSHGDDAARARASHNPRAVGQRDGDLENIGGQEAPVAKLVRRLGKPEGRGR